MVGTAYAAVLIVAAGCAAAGFAGSAAAGDAEPMQAVARCRGGQVHGEYELRTAGGALRVAGAFHDGRKTGTFVFWSAAGARLAVIPFTDDARNGTLALWHAGPAPGREGGRRLEARYRSGALEGELRRWYADGAPRSLARYEGGVLVGASAWGRAGKPLAGPQALAQEQRDRLEDEAMTAALQAQVETHQPDCQGTELKRGTALPGGRS